MEHKLTRDVKALAYSMGADLVGIAGVGRYANAPVKMSPQGILPAAKSVVVLAIHHPDAVIELDGEIHSQILGPYGIQMTMNYKLDYMSFRVARMLDDLGYAAVPIAASNIWRYRGYKDLTATFAPDISHIYGAVCAGLGELGWNGLCMTPEYGPRNRFVSIITEAELAPDPLYDGEKLCDMCRECVKTCPTDAFRKELGPDNDVVIDGKHHKFAGKNLWRCAWAEHFALDLDMDIPDVVDEKVILDASVAGHRRGGEFGVCLKVCLPKHLRVWDKDYNKKCARRKRHVTPTDLPVHRGVYDSVLNHANRWDLDEIHFIANDALKNAEIDIKSQLPDGEGAVLFVARFNTPENASEKFKNELLRNYTASARLNCEFAELDACRELEKLGYSALPKSHIKHDAVCALCGVAPSGLNETIVTELVLTSAPVISQSYRELCASGPVSDVDAFVRAAARKKGADLIGVASAARMDSLANQLREVRKGEVLLTARDTNHLFAPYIPEIKSAEREIRGATDMLPGAKSVLVLGVHFPETACERMGKPPAEAVGPYVFTQYEVNRLIGQLGFAIVHKLNAMGYKAFYTYNLTGTGTFVGSPRGEFSDAFSNTLEAVAAGIGKMTLNGTVETPKFGVNQRFIAVVTDAELTEDAVLPGLSESCGNCGACIEACPSRALDAKKIVTLNLGGADVKYLPIDQNRCDWTKRYALSNEDGNVFCGSRTNIPCPDEVSEEALSAALKEHDWVFKFRPVIAESCIVKCPLVNVNK